MANKAVELHVAGQSCRVVTTANEQELKVLAAMVEEKLRAVLTPGRPVTTQAMLLVAVALAHEAREQRARADAVAERAKVALRALMHRVDTALDAEEADSEPGATRSRGTEGGAHGPHNAGHKASEAARTPGSAGTPRTPGSAGTPRTPGSAGTPRTPGGPGKSKRDQLRGADGSPHGPHPGTPHHGRS